MINTTYNNYGIFTSGKPTLDELKTAINTYKIKKILSLDSIVGNEVKGLIEDNKLPVIQEIFHISPGAPRGECQVLFNTIRNHIDQFPILIHCSAGKDRSGFTVASWLIRTGKLSPCDAIKAVESTMGYGKGGVSEVSKNTMDDVLGCLPQKKELKEKDLNEENIKKLLKDNNFLDDTAVSKSREELFSIPGDGADKKQMWRRDYFPPSYDLLSPGFNEFGSPSEIQINIASSSNKIIKQSKVRKKLLKKLIKALNDDINIDDIVKELEDKNNPLKGLNVGQIDNYTGFANTFNLPSSAPEATRGAGAMLEGGYLQL